MIEARATTVIARPVEDVFRFVADPRNHPLWQHLLIELEVTGDDTVREVRNFFGRRIEMNGVVECEENKRVALLGTPTRAWLLGTFTADRVHTFEPEPGGTRVSFDVRIDARGQLPALAERAASRMMRRNAETGLALLKELLESHRDAPSSPNSDDPDRPSGPAA